MRGDPESRAKYYDAMWKDGFMNADEVRQRENLNPIPDGQGEAFWIPVTQQTVERALNPPEPAPAGNIGPDGSPPAPGTPKNPPAAQGGPKGKAKTRAERRRQLAHAYIPL